MTERVANNLLVSSGSYRTDAQREMEKHMNSHRHVSRKSLQRHIQESIQLQGFALRHVVPLDNSLEFSYTVGLHQLGSARPELFISGLSLQARVQWLLNLGFLIQGPPPPETQKRMAQAQGVTVESLEFPVGGQVFQTGVRYHGLAGSTLPSCFGLVEQRYYEAHFGLAIHWHGTHSFPVLQFVWPDTRGRFPFEAHFDLRFKNKQRLLFDPYPSLPLQDAERGEA